MSKLAKSIFGFYESADQIAPTYDPGPEALCPLCLRELGYPENKVRTVSLMKVENPNRSFFYRMHLKCAEAATGEQIMHIEGSVIDSEAA
jgi:hypothetical protein